MKLTIRGNTLGLKPLLFGSCLVTLFCVLGFMPQHVSALSGADYKAGRVADDSIFFNSSTMNAAQVQQFLASKVPSCDTYGTQMYNSTQTRAQYGTSKGYPAPYTCLKDYSQATPSMNAETGLCNNFYGGDRTAAQIIVDVSAACGINPQTLIVLLQKEQSLITDSWPWSNQYTKATGFACPDTAPCDPNYAGFFYQVYSAARQFKKYNRDASTYNYRAGRNNTIQYNPNAGCGGSSVYIENQATAGLYVYTPYQPNQAALNNLYGTGDSCSAYGNRNFWRMFNDWFGPTTGTFLVQAPSSSTVYLITVGGKYGVPSYNVLQAYGFDDIPVTPVGDNFVQSLKNLGTLSTTFKLEGGDGSIYLADNSYRLSFPSYERCVDWGKPNCISGAISLPMYIFNQLLDGGAADRLMLNGSTIYEMRGGSRRPFASMQAVYERGYSNDDITPITSSLTYGLPYGDYIPQNNSFIRFGTNSALYYFVNYTYFSVPNQSTLLSWYGDYGAYYNDTTSTTATSPPVAQNSLTTLLNDGAKKYLIDDGRRIDITAASAQWPQGSTNSALIASANSMPAKVADTDTTFASNDGVIYKIEGSKKRPFVSEYDYRRINQRPSITLMDNALDMPVGAIMLAEGSAYKVAGGSVIYLMGQNGKSYGFTSLKQMNDFVTNPVIPTITQAEATRYAYQGPLTNLIKDSSGTPYAINNGIKYLVSPVAASSWGFTTPNSQILSDWFIQNILSSGNPVNRFLSSPDGGIYMSGGGVKRPISSYERYKSLGGTSQNTAQLSKDVIDALPNGPVVQ